MYVQAIYQQINFTCLKLYWDTFYAEISPYLLYELPKYLCMDASVWWDTLVQVSRVTGKSHK